MKLFSMVFLVIQSKFLVGEKPDNPLNEFATDLTLSEVERIRKYVFSSILVQKYVPFVPSFHRYTFVKEIQRCCENGNFDGIYKVILPIVGRIAGDRDSCIRATLLDQFEYIAKVVES